MTGTAKRQLSPERDKNDAHQRVLSKADLASLRQRYAGSRIGLCHGAFDMVHIGHIEHLEEAKEHCDILVVSLTSDRFVTKHPLGTYHSALQRAHLLATLRTVDYVYIDDNKEAMDVLSTLKPNFYFKGIDYAEQIKTNPALKREADACIAAGGKIIFTRTIKHSSSYLLNNYLDERRIAISEYLRTYEIRGDRDYLEGIYAALRQSTILLLGEAILDIYTYGRLTGISSKYTASSFLESHTKAMMGGSLVLIPLLANHAKHVTTLVPEDYNVSEQFASRDRITSQKENFPYVEKIRFISEKKKERLFEAVRITPGKRFQVGKTVDSLVARSDYSAVLLYDFGHGFFDDAALMNAHPDRFYALNVQANSTNYPFNGVGKYPHYNLLTMDERELRITLHDNKSSLETLMQKFVDRSPIKDSAYFFFTAGEHGAWCYHKGERIHCPALVSSVVDATGSGDVFHAIATLCIVSGINIGTSLFFASLYAGLYAQVEGHDGTIVKEQIIRAITSML